MKRWQKEYNEMIRLHNIEVAEMEEAHAEWCQMAREGRVYNMETDTFDLAET